MARSDLSTRVVRPLASTTARAFMRVTVHADATDIMDAWADLEENSPCSIYQTRAFLLPWLGTLGLKAGLTPLFVLARDADETPIMLLCLGIEKRGPLTIASWLGGKDVNLAMPLTRRGRTWGHDDVSELLRSAGKAYGRALDLFVLPNQPHGWSGEPNPLALLPHQTSPSAAYGTALPVQAEDLFAQKLSKDTRKKLRKKETKLVAFGPLVHRIATTKSERERLIDAFLAFKIARFRALGIPSDFATPEMRAFLTMAHASGGVELHGLETGDRIVAIYGGGAHGGQWSGMFNAFDPDGEIAKSSPGDLLLMRIVAKACKDGLSGFDLGIGEARYKAALCDEAIALFDLTVPMSRRGSVVASVFAARQHAKRAIKQNPRLVGLVKTLRGLGARFR